MQGGDEGQQEVVGVSRFKELLDLGWSRVVCLKLSSWRVQLWLHLDLRQYCSKAMSGEPCLTFHVPIAVFLKSKEKETR